MAYPSYLGRLGFQVTRGFYLNLELSCFKPRYLSHLIMSNHGIQSYSVKRESGEQSIHSYQAVWMAHWSQTRKEASLAHNNLAVDHMSVEGNSVPVTKRHLPYLSGPDAATDGCGSKEFTEVPMAGPADVPDRSVDVVSQFLRKERLEHDHHFPMFGINRGKSVLTSKHDQASSFYGQAPEPQFNSKTALNTSPRDLLKPEMFPWPPSGHPEHILDLGATSHDLIEKSSMLLSTPFKDSFLASCSRYPIRPSVGRLEKANGSSSFFTAKEHLHTGFTNLEPDQCNYPSSSIVLVHELDKDPLKSKNQSSFFLGDNAYRSGLKNHLGSRFFQSQTGPFDIAEAECSSQLRNSFFDVETMRICTTVGSMKGSQFHRTMKELFFSEKKADANLLRGGNIIRESTVSTTPKFKGNTNTFTEVPGLSQNGGLKSHQQGVKLQPLWSSTDSEEKENALDLKNESSAETNTMDMDSLREDHPCGDEVSLSSKDFVGFKKLLASRVAAGCKSEEGSGRENADLPSSHQNCVELPSAEPISTDDKEPSMSKTQSLDAAFLLPDADGRMATNSTLRSTQSGPDPGSRWVKRLKISASESFLAHGTKTSQMEEATSSRKKFNPFSGKTLKRAMSSSEPLTSKKSREKKQMFDGNEQLPIKDGVSSSTSESIGKIRDELLSHSWIRRWCRNQSQAQKQKPGEGEEAAFVFCEPRRLNVSLDEIQKKQLPSIAAMALMGRAMNGFRPCEFRKRGTCVVWNTK